MTMKEKLAIHKQITEEDKAHRLKYYVYTYRDNAGGGKRNILAASEKEANKRLRQFLNQYHPFRKYHIELEQVLPG